MSLSSICQINTLVFPSIKNLSQSFTINVNLRWEFLTLSPIIISLKAFCLPDSPTKSHADHRGISKWQGGTDNLGWLSSNERKGRLEKRLYNFGDFWWKQKWSDLLGGFSKEFWCIKGDNGQAWREGTLISKNNRVRKQRQINIL